MKNTIALFILAGTCSIAFAAENPVSDPNITVMKVADQYAANHEDLGSNVPTQCDTRTSGDTFRVTCSGAYEVMGPGHGGYINVEFECTGDFAESADAVITQQGKVECKQKI